MAKHAEFELSEPIVVDGKSITKLTIRTPRVKDMVAALRVSGGDTGAIYMAAMTASLCDIPWLSFQEILQEDAYGILAAASELAKNFPGAAGVNSSS